MSTDRFWRFIAPSFKARRAVVLACLATLAIVWIWLEWDEYSTYRDLKQYVESIGGRAECLETYDAYNPFKLQYVIYGPDRNLKHDEQAKLDAFAKHLYVNRIYKQHEVIVFFHKDGQTGTRWLKD